MYIVNAKTEDLFKCGKIVHKYLYDKIPLLSKDEEYFYYAKTEKLESLLQEAPIWIKAVIKCSR